MKSKRCPTCNLLVRIPSTPVRNAARARVCDAASDHGGISRIEPDPDMPSLTYYTCRDGTRMAVGPEVKEAPYAEFGGF